MASYSSPKLVTFLADGAIALGKAVKIGTDKKHVAVCTSTTDKPIGIIQTAATAAEDTVEVAVIGGGAKALCQTTVAAGKLLVSHTDGALKPIATAGDHLVCKAMEDGVAADIIGVEICYGHAYTTES